MNPGLPTEALDDVAETLARLNIEYYIGGSVASVVHGLPRSTIDIDLVADIQTQHVGQFATSLRDRFYLDENTIADSVRMRRSFNIIHLAIMYKVDIFPIRDRPFDQIARTRIVSSPLSEHDDRAYPIASP